ncbi:MAG: hypothetical protein GFH27_549279n408 [Chloroflexi bacterium AL-W]|nr:hypothetical protein [Chloroflexi bacterium AL-N1]NOK65374.1 hypothetical protein [Chloroflexi bacterium AL-N10]NOK72360.1 hypothetical protein [Chloroflexi bacterium AL-N5]NOK79553.1 hypothetical protein [Chloroflexi bacterium AL-W]NOK87469.1 hypothetical protein [Chloroflexi bacterium AL-N15]
MQHQSQTATSDSTQGGRTVLTLLYTLFAVAAGARALFQSATKWEQAPLAYTLSTIAALVYLIACVGINRTSPSAWRITLGVCVFELIGVLSVGTLTLIYPTLFLDETVWSVYGQGYAFIPLVLPIIGIVWLMQPATRRVYGVLPSTNT